MPPPPPPPPQVASYSPSPAQQYPPPPPPDAGPAPSSPGSSTYGTQAGYSSYRPNSSVVSQAIEHCFKNGSYIFLHVYLCSN